MTTDDFETFWRAYPRRIAKGNARKAFANAIRKTSLATMLEAVAAYIEHKPAYCDFKHPSTWLNSEGWDDDWTPAPVGRNQPQQQKRTLLDAATQFGFSAGSAHVNHPYADGNGDTSWNRPGRFDQLIYDGDRRH